MDNNSKQKTVAARRSPASHRSSPASTARPRPLTKKHFPFLKLPPELRELVYEHLLVHKLLKIGLLCKRNGKPKAFATSNEAPDYGNGREGLFGEFDPAVLRVSRLIHNEALPIIYGKNTFFFINCIAVDLFLDSMVNLRSSTVSPGIQHLHHVVISGPQRANFFTTMRDLRVLKNLKTLAVEVFDTDLVIERSDDVYHPWDDESGLVAAVTQFIDLSASVEERRRQVDKISFAYNNRRCDKGNKLSIPGDEVPARCKALLAEFVNVTLHE
ncbi:hypothetical protein M409DRAFT_25183 [Zasmidium cellare ATCC 36951]|uniref:F-box domain-containing protein n=1 Tax=Zasmidium cellare ATCC 36951 TaxID=1080233 RepID=A0A6A6CAV3_ZASCE|nr:uncharacterized protein M409DRAFT_25183 [Zasmidium cellare ATCC 36951]KAF2164304.1 hypothetical protein M409DRAFT_25183 [Zasmidium cellare ATCC 36951]